MNDNLQTVDLTNCDREPIHLLGAIQPIGFLLALSPELVIMRASANAGEFLRCDSLALIGQPLASLFGAEVIHTLRNRLSLLEGGGGVERVFGCTLQAECKPFDIAIHVSGGLIILEAEPSSDEHGDATNIVRSMIARLDRTSTLDTFLNEGGRLVRALTGYDRVMVYRFADDGSGEVAAEACRPGIGSFKGLHYPASDIPAQARKLYTINLLRVGQRRRSTCHCRCCGPFLRSTSNISRTWAWARRCRSLSLSTIACGDYLHVTIMSRAR